VSGPRLLPPRILAAVVAVAARLDAAGIPWLLGGSAGRAALGFRRRPRDVDVEVRAEQAAAAAAALGAALARADDGTRSAWRASTTLAGVEVDLSAGLTVERPGGRPPLAADFDLERAFARPVLLAGRHVWVAPPEEPLAVAIAAGDWGRFVRALEGAPRGLGLRASYLERRLAAAARAIR
jgi:hypothetical protein